jgi:hypothetical protein
MYNSHGRDDFDLRLINGINAFVLAGKYNAWGISFSFCIIILLTIYQAAALRTWCFICTQEMNELKYQKPIIKTSLSWTMK